MRSQVRFEERCGYAWWVHALIVFVVLACVVPYLADLGLIPGAGKAPDPGRASLFPLFLGLAIFVLFYGLMGELRTRVTDTGISLAWGAAELFRKEIPFTEIRGAKAVTYSPLREFGGWGIRWGSKGKIAWTTRGNRALRLELANGKLFYIGSDRPERIVPLIRLGEKKGKA
jgi:hypothetical protein